ncbi:DNA methyltransferase [Pseudarthrobacter sp. B4EP4b]|uniref:class I SAM-dependent DNA methyltransferase n=1 Tax=Pseudarthrobacter sp. B4EP4b TaxID=2590664 RepID=UPI002104B804|nr:DNA methyltransferase [Pseudarthrobacter sp. B4EP4b]
MAANLLGLVESHSYQVLFLAHLRWSRPDLPAIAVDVDGAPFTVTNLSSYKGLRVWVCPVLPNASKQAEIDRAIAKKSTDRIVIFHNDERQVWRWPSRTVKGGATSTRLTSHAHVTGMSNPKLVERLQLITLAITEDLSVTQVIERVRQAFDVETEKETKRASKLMASMYDTLAQADCSEHAISVTLARLLFLLFGDDTDMWTKDLFQEFLIEHTSPDGSDLAERLNELFAYLDTRPADRDGVGPHLAGFKYINGGLFSERITLPKVGQGLRTTILDACSSNWSDISPAIFGSMFQSVRDDKTRREYGEHYTSETDILKTLNPLFLDELRDEFARAVGHREEYSRLIKLRERLGRIRFLDPACGCGNFIIIAYREMRLLEISVLERIRVKESEQLVSLAVNQLEFGLEGELDAAGASRTTLLDPVVRLDNFFGIEIDEWPAKIAETAMFLIDRQCDLQMLERLGFAPERLPIQRQASIISATPENPSGGNALKLDWKDIISPGPDSIIAGNPPFIGMAWMDKAQQNDNRQIFAMLPEAQGERTGRLDYVACWYAKAIDYLRGSQARVAFVSTNSITQGDQARALDPILKRAGVHIDFAHRTFKWQSEATGGAAVHCVIIGMSTTGRPQRVLFDYPQLSGSPVARPVTAINMYLLDSDLPAPVKRRVPFYAHLPKMTKGSQATDGGHLIVENLEDLISLKADPAVQKYLRPFMQGRDMLNSTEKWCLWFESAQLAELQRVPALAARLEGVAIARLQSPTVSVQKQAAIPHLFTQRRQPKNRYLALPEVSSEDREYVPMTYLEADVIAGNKLIHVDGCPEWLFGVLQSRIFMVWLRTFAGRLKSDLSISPDLAYCAFPFPDLSAGQKEVIASLAERIMETRLELGKPLSVLYKRGQTPSQLASLHDKLDAAVADAFELHVEDELEVASELLKRHHILVGTVEAREVSPRLLGAAANA